jgi:hypothetical protein
MHNIVHSSAPWLELLYSGENRFGEPEDPAGHSTMINPDQEIVLPPGRGMVLSKMPQAKGYEALLHSLLYEHVLH